MGIVQKQVPKHWGYFLMLENDLTSLARYVDFHRDNFNTYSLEISRLLVSTCGEVDAVLKQLCLAIGCPTTNRYDVVYYENHINQHFPSFRNTQISLPSYGMTLKPWSNWANRVPSTPDWWKGHNGIKHNRHAEFKAGNLKNLLNGLAGLYVSLLYFHNHEKSLDSLKPNPSLFFPDTLYNGETMEYGTFRFEYGGF